MLADDARFEFRGLLRSPTFLWLASPAAQNSPCTVIYLVHTTCVTHQCHGSRVIWSKMKNRGGQRLKWAYQILFRLRRKSSGNKSDGKDRFFWTEKRWSSKRRNVSSRLESSAHTDERKWNFSNLHAYRTRMHSKECFSDFEVIDPREVSFVSWIPYSRRFCAVHAHFLDSVSGW